MTRPTRVFRRFALVLGLSLAWATCSQTPGGPPDASRPVTLDPAADEDGDGYANGVEATYGSDPRDAASRPADQDADGVVDALDDDLDGDGYANDVETRFGADPRSADSRPQDSDGDGIPDPVDQDADADGVQNAADAFPFDAAEWADTDLDGTGDNADPDDDGDGYNDDVEAAAGTDPLDRRSVPGDVDLDGLPDAVDDDLDGDGTPNLLDAFPQNPAESVDTDADGLGNNADTDDDGDGYPDAVEATAGTNALDAASRPVDVDGDGIPDTVDPDADGDGVLNDTDAFPLDADEWTDADGDGMGDNADPDDDGDNYPDTVERLLGTDPFDPASRPADLDGDGVPDSQDPDADGDAVLNTGDAFPFDPAEAADHDLDGVGDNADTDDDNDGWEDAAELQAASDPLDPQSRPADLDHDSIPDATDPDRDGDGVANAQDAFPSDPTETADLDGDQVGDNADTDDDGDGYLDGHETLLGTDPRDAQSFPVDMDRDGVPDVLDADVDGDGVDNPSDAFPLDPTESRDTDLDGVGNVADDDDDGDGFTDAVEATYNTDPLSAVSTPPDLDGDKQPDPVDPDTDGDGVNNAADPFPADGREWLDTDADGTGNNGDLDDDGDGYADTAEVRYGSDPLLATSTPPDLDGDRIADGDDTDRDGDGYLNTVDAFPDNAAEWADTDLDTLGNNADLDDDADGYDDTVETTYGTNTLDPASIPPDLDADRIPDREDPDRDGDTYLNDVDAFPDDRTRWEAAVPLTSFGGRYQDVIPPNADPAAFDETRFSILRGRVVDPTGAPMAGVGVRVHGHPEYGTKATNAAGEWEFAVNGGGVVTVRFDRTDAPSVDRNFQVAWNDIVVAPPVELTPADPVATTDSLSGSATEAIVHQNEGFEAPVTVVIPKNVVATGTLANGSQQTLSTLAVRATEYRTPEGMPASLPPSSLFTLCVELTVDGYEHVEFSAPVTVWVPNFLGFAVGDAVPFGYYDRILAAWKPLPDGIIVQLLDTDGDTLVDAVDGTGDGIADDITGDGTTTDEVFSVQTQSGFVPGAQFWRMLTDHFSPMDPNYPTGPCPSCGPPPGGGSSSGGSSSGGSSSGGSSSGGSSSGGSSSGGSSSGGSSSGGSSSSGGPGGGPDSPGDKPDKGKPCGQGGSSRINTRARTLHQDIPLVGTPLTLHYNSEWVDGFATPVTFPLSLDSLPESLKGIKARYGIAGIEMSTERLPLPNQSATLLWDGRDYRGDPVRGRAMAWADVSFIYKPYYYTNRAQAGEAARSFAGTGARVSGTFTRGDVTVSRRWEFPVYRTEQWGNGVKTRLGKGWALGGYYTYDHASRTVIDGSGRRISAADLGKVVATANTATLPDQPGPLAVDDKGNVFFAPISTSLANNVIYRLDGATGVVTRYFVAAEGVDDIGMDPRGGLVFSSGSLVWRLNPQTMQASAVANLYFEYFECFASTGDSCRVEVAVDPGGYIRAVARYIGAHSTGNHMSLISPDGRVVRFPLNFYCVVGDLAVAPDGSSLISCSAGPVRRLDPNGTVTTLPGWNPDCNVAATYSGGAGMAVTASGGIYLADSVCNRVSKIDPSFGSNAFLGRGTAGNSGDGGALLDAQLNNPRGVALSPDGRLFVADTRNSAIRTVKKQTGIVEVPDGETYIPFEEGSVLVFSDTHVLKAVRSLDTGTDQRTFQYDASLRLASVTEADGAQTTFSYDAQDRVTTITGPFGAATRLEYDAGGRLSALQRDDATSFTFGYDFKDLMEWKATPNGDRSTYRYDAAGRIQEAARGGTIATYAREAAPGLQGSRTSLTTPAGTMEWVDQVGQDGSRTTRTGAPNAPATTGFHSADGLLNRYTVPDGSALTQISAYDPRDGTSFVTKTTSTTPAGLSRVLEQSRTFVPGTRVYTKTFRQNGSVVLTDRFDPASRTRTLTGADGLVRTLTLDSKDRLVSAATPGKDPVTLTYRADGLLETTTRGTATTRLVYNSRGYVTQVVRPDSSTIDYGPDEMGRLGSVTWADGSSYSYEFNPGSAEHPLGQVARIVRPDASQVLFDYDARERLSRVTLPDGSAREWTFGADGRLSGMIRPDGTRRSFGWGAAGLERVDDTGAPGDVPATIAYNATGQPARFVSSTGVSWELTYDGALLRSKRWTGHPGLGLDMTYDGNHRPVSLVVAGSTSTIGYDAAGRVNRAGPVTLTYDATSGMLTRTTDGTGQSDWLLNSAGHVRRMTHRVGAGTFQVDLGFDALDRVTSVTELEPGAGTRTRLFTLDPRGRVTAVEENGTPVEAYTYDGNGNRLSAENSALGYTASQAWTWLPGDRLAARPGASFTYDANGNRSSKTEGTSTTTYTHAGERLRSVTLPDGTVVGYRYDHRGLLAERERNGVVTHRYVFGPLGELLAVADGNDVVQERYHWVRGQPVRVDRGGSSYWLGTDAVGSIRFVLDASGAVVQSIKYDSFGNRLAVSNPGFVLALGYAGGLLDPDTGLLRMGLRNYDPSDAVFIQADPLNYAGGGNLYQYAEGAPHSHRDQLGTSATTVVNATGTVLSGAGTVLSMVGDATGNTAVQNTATVLSAVGGVISGHGAIMGSEGALGAVLGEGLGGILNSTFGLSGIKQGDNPTLRDSSLLADSIMTGADMVLGAAGVTAALAAGATVGTIAAGAVGALGAGYAAGKFADHLVKEATGTGIGEYIGGKLYDWFGPKPCF